MLWFNGRFADEATSNATSAGALLGWGVFTTIGVWNAQPFALPQHLARLQHDAAHCEIEYSIDDETLDSALHELISRHKITRGMARISITKRGDGRWNTQSGSDVSILVRPIKDETVPAKITTSPFRMHSKRALCGVKSTSYLDYQLAWNEAQSRGFDEAILLNEQSSVCEGARSNLFWTRDGNLFTPSLSTGCLPGIARALVLDWAREAKLKTHEIEYSTEHLRDADGVFLTSATTGIRAVSAFGKSRFSSNETIEVLQNRWRDAVNYGNEP